MLEKSLNFNVVNNGILAQLCKISMDGLNILHQVHRAFQNGIMASGWGLETFLSSCYWLLRRTDMMRRVLKVYRFF